MEENKGYIFVTKEPIPTFSEFLEMQLQELIATENYEEAEKLKRAIEVSKKDSVSF